MKNKNKKPHKTIPEIKLHIARARVFLQCDFTEIADYELMLAEAAPDQMVPKPSAAAIRRFNESTHSMCYMINDVCVLGCNRS